MSFQIYGLIAFVHAPLYVVRRVDTRPWFGPQPSDKWI